MNFFIKFNLNHYYMSKYSNANNNLAQYTEGFEEGYSKCGNELYELSDAEFTDNESSVRGEENHVRFEDANTDVFVDPNVIYEDAPFAPENEDSVDPDQYDSSYVEENFNPSELVKNGVDNVKTSSKTLMSQFTRFYNDHWVLVWFLTIVCVVAALFYFGVISWPRDKNMISYDSTSELSISAFTVGSLGQNVVQLFARHN